MSDIKDEEEYIITTTDSTDELIIDIKDFPVSDNTISIDVPYVQQDPIQSINPYPSIWLDQTQEIADLKKEIQALKDMIAEHILLGHQDK